MTTTLTAIKPSFDGVQTSGPLSLFTTAEFRTGKKDDFTWISSDMAMVHNVFMRGWNSIYLQAPHVSDRDYADFIRYALVWHDVLDIHHDTEEKDLFPRFEREIGAPGFMSPAIEQHAAFHDGLHAFGTYLRACSSKPESFEPSKLIAIMDSFGTALHAHMAEEPELLLKLSQWNFPAKEIFIAHAKQSLGKVSVLDQMGFVWVNHDMEFEGGLWRNWPVAPKAMIWVMRNIFSRWNSQLWRFGACDMQGRRHEYLALREEYHS